MIVKGAVSKVVSTGIKLEKHQWNEQEKKVTAHPNKRILNQKIEKKKSDLQQDVTRAELLGAPMTKDLVKKIVEGKGLTTDFYKWSEEYIKDAYTKEGTIKQNTTEINKLKAFAPSLQFGDIDARFIMRYEKYLREKLKNKGNTPRKSLKFIRKILYAAKGLTPHNPFEEGDYKMPRELPTERDGLYLDELKGLEKLLEQPHPVVIKILTAKFLFMCYTGLRISDAKRFKEDFIKNGERLVVTSIKTGITTNTKIHNRLQNILLRLKELPDKSISDQKFNEYLKIIAELAGISRLNVTSHLGRHTYGCLLAEAGVSEEEAMELMGIKDKKIIRVYYRLRQPQIDKAAEKLNAL